MSKPLVSAGTVWSWTDVQQSIANSVVQVVVQTIPFNWLEPYKIEPHFEVSGTGFFIDDAGHLITNAHVVDQAHAVWIYVPSVGMQAIFADIVSISPDRDIALLKVTAEGYAFLREQLGGITSVVCGDSDKLRRADDVLVVGYPLGQHGIKSATGVVSGRESGSGRTLIQITAPVNPGNSGGPLINKEGHVVGIAISSMLTAQNVGYVIPINDLKVIYNELFEKPFVRRPLLGALFNYTTNDHALFLGNPTPAGFYINTVLKDSLLDRVGVKAGDMLYSCNGYTLDSFGQTVVPWSSERVTIHDLLARVKTGDQVEITTYRAGKQHKYSFVFDLVAPLPIHFVHPEHEKVEYEIIGGMVIMQLAANHIPLLANTVHSLVRYTQLSQCYESVLIITSLLPGSLAQQSRCLFPGLLLDMINGVSVRTLTDLQGVVQQLSMQDVLIIKTQENIETVFTVSDIVADEARLEQFFAYQASGFIRRLRSMSQVQ